MIELPLVLIAGILGSSHCIGMCGPLALTVGSGASSWRANLVRQSVYTLGRIFTYCVLGAAAGFVGWKVQHTTWLVNAAAILAVVAGGFLLYQGLLAAGVWRRKTPNTAALPCLGSEFLAGFLKAPGWANVFLAGLFTGLIPCGLVYGFLALAASSGDVLAGLAIMAVFGVGTAPVMMLTGCGATLLSLAARRYAYRIAAWCVVLTGMLAIARGCGFLHLAGWETAGCPFCH